MQLRSQEIERYPYSMLDFSNGGTVKKRCNASITGAALLRPAPKARSSLTCYAHLLTDSAISDSVVLKHIFAEGAAA